jgi:predicted AAA+ superfamily ATPase
VILFDDTEKKKRKLEFLTTDYIKKDIFEANINEVNVFFNLLKILAGQTGELLNVQSLSSVL